MKIRLRLAKENIFISHLEFVRAIIRALRRSELPVRYTAGFHPRIVMSVSPALAVGIKSQYEYVDLELIQKMETGEILTSLNNQLPEGIKLREVMELPSLSRPIGNGQALIHYRLTDIPEDWVSRMEELKKGLVSAGVREVRLEAALKQMELIVEIGPGKTINPLKILKEKVGLNPEEAGVTIEKIYFKEL